MGSGRQGDGVEGKNLKKGPVLVSRRTCSGTGQDVGATVPMAVGRRANVLLCAIEVEGLKRRPTEVGGLSLEFRV